VGQKEDLGRKGISSRTTAFSVPRRMLSDGGGEVVMENDWSLVENIHTILLGETKYYQARNNPDNLGKLVVEERATPVLSGGIADNVWLDDPVTAVSGGKVDVAYGKKLGVYWEKEKPILGGTGDLPRGLMRLVGRYWIGDSTYIVKLSATHGERSGSTHIVVKKPRLLGDDLFARTRDQAIDIESRSYSVDSVCIKWGGIYGFPPQNIKGQYQSESVFDPQLDAYAPAYRYEPWSAEFWPGVQRLSSTSHFWVTRESMGDGDGVPD
jgi:hypothetical protein